MLIFPQGSRRPSSRVDLNCGVAPLPADARGKRRSTRVGGTSRPRCQGRGPRGDTSTLPAGHVKRGLNLRSSLRPTTVDRGCRAQPAGLQLGGGRVGRSRRPRSQGQALQRASARVAGGPFADGRRALLVNGIHPRAGWQPQPGPPFPVSVSSVGPGLAGTGPVGRRTLAP